MRFSLLKFTFRLGMMVLAFALLAACSKGEKALRSGQEMRAVATPAINSGTMISTRWRASVDSSDVDQPTYFVPAFTSNAVFIAGNEGEVARFEIETGELVWRQKLGLEITAAIGVDKAIVAVASSEGEVIALSASDGKIVWRKSLGVAISASPVVGQDRVIVRSLDGQVIALKATTGDHIWAYQRPISSLSMSGDAIPLIAGEGLVTGFSNGRIVVNNVFSGQVFWEKRQFRPAGNNLVERLIDIDAEPTLLGKYVLVGAYQGGIAALRLRDGQEVWRSPVSTRQKIAFNEVGVYVTADDGSVYMLNIDTGETLWAQPGLRGHGVSNPVVIDSDSIYVGDIDGQLYSLSIKDGKLNGRSGISKGAITSLHQQLGVIYAYSSKTGQVVALK